MNRPLLDVNGLVKQFPITEGVVSREVGRVRAVDGVSFTLSAGETLGLVGESGCGKSTTAATLLRLEEPTDGQVLFDGEDVAGYDRAELKRFRRRAQMIFQDPASSLDPRMSVGESVAEPLRIHGMRDRARRRRIAEDLLERVGLDASDVDRYPHEFSGGQKQRVALARALVVNPDLLVADEPVSALDVSVQADILALIERIQAEFGLAILFISHDMAAVREVCDRVAVMYLGEIVETARTDVLFEAPAHPYTRALLSSVPSLDPRRRGRGVVLTGDVPSPSDPPPGCRFHTRCPEVIPPEGLDLDQADWRAVTNLRVRVANRNVDLDAARELVVGPEADPAAAAPEAVAAALRDEFDVPATLDDPDAEAALAAALDHVVAGDFEVADRAFAEAFPTVCRDRRPGLRLAGFDLTAEQWRAVRDLRTWLASRAPEEGVDAARDLVAERSDRTDASAGTDRRAALREAFGVDAPLPDRRAEAAVSTALDRLLAGRPAEAADRLYETFDDRHAAACFRSFREAPRVDRSTGDPTADHPAGDDPPVDDQSAGDPPVDD